MPRGIEPRDVEPLWRLRDYRMYWSASTISHAGSALTNVALPLLVFGLTGSTLLTGLVVAVEGGYSGGASWFSRIVRMRC